MAGPQLSVVLPVSVSRTGRDRDDAERLELALASFLKHFRLADLHAFWIVCPDEDATAVRARVAALTRDPRFVVVDENELCPELRLDPDTSDDWPRPNRGWVRQQLLKLAIHDRVATPFYLTMDADIISVRPFALADLVRDGRGLYGIESPADYAELYTRGFAPAEAGIKRGRGEHASRVLGVSGSTERIYSETPVLLCTDVVRALAAHVAARHHLPWRQALLEHLPWTEISLYFRFAEITGLLDRRHVAGGRNAVLRLDGSLWQPADRYPDRRCLDSWDTARAFAPRGAGFFVAVQSHLGYGASKVRNKVKLVMALVALAAVSCGSSRMMQEQPIEQPVPTASGPPPPLTDDPHAVIEKLDADLDVRRAKLSLPPPPAPRADECTPVCSIDTAPGLPSHIPECAHPAGTTCGDTCAQVDGTCDDAAQICDIAKKSPTEEWLAGRCHQAVFTCQTAGPMCCNC